MAQVIKCYLGVWLLILLCVIQAGILNLGFETYQAQTFLRRMQTELECSDFSSVVADELKKEAENNGYEATILLREENEHKVAHLRLVIPYELEFLNVDSKREMEVTIW